MHVTLYASNSHQEFRERGNQLAAMLKMPLKEAGRHKIVPREGADVLDPGKLVSVRPIAG